MTTTMRAAVCTRAGDPGVLEVRTVPVPALRDGWSLVRVMGAGLNRSELRTRQGHSPGVSFPRVLGIECVGVVAGSTDPVLPEGTTVAAVMGDMGRAFDGGYAEYALLPNALLMPLTTTLAWEVLAALPESYLTAQGALDALGAKAGDRLLIRGGTSSVGLAAASIASAAGVEVAATTRRRDRPAALTAAGADHVLVDDGHRRTPQTKNPDHLPTGNSHPRTPKAKSRNHLPADGGHPRAPQALNSDHLPTGNSRLRTPWAGGPSHVLDLVGADTVVDSLRLVRPGGTVCVAGSLSGWLLRDFEPIAMIPPGTRLTAFHSHSVKGSAGAAILQRIVHNVESGVYRPNVDRVFGLDDIVAAHRRMEAAEATGKLVMIP
jgi:NADPH:quinone reductase-like Zn-dependent oxidoreductase